MARKALLDMETANTTTLQQQPPKRPKKTPAPSAQAPRRKRTGREKAELKGIRAHGDRWKVEVMVKGLRTSGTVDSLEEAVILRKMLIERLEKQHQSPAAAVAEGMSFSSSSSSSLSSSPALRRREEEEEPWQTTALAPKGRQWTLKTAVDKTFQLIWKDTADEDRQRIRVRHLLEFFGETCLVTEIDAEKVVAFREWAEDTMGNSPNTVNKKVCALSRILRTALEMGKLNKLPKLHLARVKNNRIRFLLPEEEGMLLGTFERLASKDHLDACIVLLDTGFRLGELWTLTAANINPMNGTVSLWDGETKNGLARTVPMTSRVRAILMRRREQHPTGPLWPGCTNNWFQHQWNKVREALGKTKDPDWVTHMLRHTCCSRLVQAGVNLFMVQQWMGHRSLSITQRYAHHGPQHLRNAGAALEEFTSKSAAAGTTRTA